jgi:hypothetical protein
LGEHTSGFFRERSIANLQLILEEFLQVLYWRTRKRGVAEDEDQGIKKRLKRRSLESFFYVW